MMIATRVAAAGGVSNLRSGRNILIRYGQKRSMAKTASDVFETVPTLRGFSVVVGTAQQISITLGYGYEQGRDESMS